MDRCEVVVTYPLARGSSSMVEPQPSKLVVAGSSPVCRSIKSQAAVSFGCGGFTFVRRRRLS